MLHPDTLRKILQLIIKQYGQHDLPYFLHYTSYIIQIIYREDAHEIYLAKDIYIKGKCERFLSASVFNNTYNTFAFTPLT